MKSKLPLLILCLVLITGCSSDSDPESKVANVETEVVMFNYEQNLEENTFEVEFNIKHTNKSGFPVKGFSRVEVKNVGDDFTYIFVREISQVSCAELATGEICFDKFFRTGDLGSPEDYGPDGPPMVELVSATFVVFEEN